MTQSHHMTTVNPHDSSYSHSIRRPLRQTQLSRSEARIHHGNRGDVLLPSGLEILVEAYEEVKEQIERNDNTPAVVKQRENAWQSPGDPPECACGALIHTGCSAETIAVA